MSPDHRKEKSHSCFYQMDHIKLITLPLDSSFNALKEFKYNHRY